MVNFGVCLNKNLQNPTPIVVTLSYDTIFSTYKPPNAIGQYVGKPTPFAETTSKEAIFSAAHSGITLDTMSEK